MTDPVKALLNIEKALKDPSSVFDAPDEIADSPVLTKTQKLKLLEVWEHDEILLQTAAQENMSGGEPNILQQVKLAIEKVNRQPA